MYVSEALVTVAYSQAYTAPAIKKSTQVLRMVKVLNIAVEPFSLGQLPVYPLLVPV